MTDAASRLFRTRAYWIAALIIVLLAIAAQTLAEQNGCPIHEGFANSCIIAGADWGETRYAGFVLGWPFLASAPLGIVALAVLVAAMA